MVDQAYRVCHNGPRSGRSRSGGHMKRTLLGLVALWLTALPATVGCAAGNAMLGTWKLKESSAHILPGAPKPVTFVFTAVGDDVKVTVDGLEANEIGRAHV